MNTKPSILRVTTLSALVPLTLGGCGGDSICVQCNVDADCVALGKATCTTSICR